MKEVIFQKIILKKLIKMGKKHYFIREGQRGSKAEMVHELKLFEEKGMVLGKDLPSAFELGPPKNRIMPICLIPPGKAKLVEVDGLRKRVFELYELGDSSTMIDVDTHLDNTQRESMRKLARVFHPRSEMISQEVKKKRMVDEKRAQEIWMVFYNHPETESVRWADIDRKLLSLDKDQIRLINYVLKRLENRALINDSETWREAPEWDETMARILEVVRPRSKRAKKNHSEFQPEIMIPPRFIEANFSFLGSVVGNERRRFAAQLRAHYEQFPKIAEPERQNHAKILAGALMDTEENVRRDIAVVSGIFELQEAIIPLSYLLKGDPNFEVRYEAARALRNIKDKSTIPALIDGLTDDNIEVAMECRKALTHKTTHGEITAISTLGLSHDNPVARECTCDILEKIIKKQRSNTELVEAREQTKLKVRQALEKEQNTIVSVKLRRIMNA